MVCLGTDDDITLLKPFQGKRETGLASARVCCYYDDNGNLAAWDSPLVTNADAPGFMKRIPT